MLRCIYHLIISRDLSATYKGNLAIATLRPQGLRLQTHLEQNQHYGIDPRTSFCGFHYIPNSTSSVPNSGLDSESSEKVSERAYISVPLLFTCESDHPNHPRFPFRN